MTSYLAWRKKTSTLFTRIYADTRIFLLSSFSLQMCNRSSRWWIPTVDLFPGDRPGDGAVCFVRSGLHLHFSCRCRGRRARIGTNRVVFITLGPNKKPRPSARDHCPAALSLLYEVALGVRPSLSSPLPLSLRPESGPRPVGTTTPGPLFHRKEQHRQGHPFRQPNCPLGTRCFGRGRKGRGADPRRLRTAFELLQTESPF